jgi:adenylate cyclase
MKPREKELSPRGSSSIFDPCGAEQPHKFIEQLFRESGWPVGYKTRHARETHMTFSKTRIRQRWFGAAWGALMTLLAGLLLYLFPFGEWARFLSYDIPFAFRQVSPPTNVVLVYLDEYSYEMMKEPKNQGWNRLHHAELIDRITEAGAAAIVFDFLFTDATPLKPGEQASPSDEAFARAIEKSHKVILGGEVRRENSVLVNDIPLRRFREAAAGWGLVQFRKKSFGPREHLDSEALQEGIHPLKLENIENRSSLAWAAARVAGADVTKTSTQDSVKRWINYYGPPGTIESKHYADVHEGLVPADVFRDKIVFIGSRKSTDFAGAGKDEFPTAFTWKSRTYSPGTEIHATVVLNLLRKDWLTRFPKNAELFLVVFFGLGAGFGLSILLSRAATAVALVSCAGVMLAAWLFFRYQLVWFAWLIIVVQLLFALFWAAVFNSIQAYAERKILEHSLALHLPARRVKQILKSPELLAPSAEKQEVSLMFTDIADWSTISDRVAPDRLFKHLNRYFEKTIPCVHREDGMVLQLIGDAIFALWNAPEPQTNHQERACAAALKLRDELVEFESGNENYPLRTRVGLHCGPASVGNCGSADRLVYTALGAETNMAARLEGLNKYLGTQILASDRIVTESVEAKFTWRCIGRFKLKGSDRVLEIYELLDTKDKEENSRAWRKLFSTGLRHFQRQEWDHAMDAFSQVIVERKDDGPSRFYLRKIETLRDEKLPEKWFGEISMDEK